MTEEGKLQALNAGVKLREIVGQETVSFFVSPYRSCKQTFQYLSGSFSEQGVNYTEDPRLRNQYFGDWNKVEAPTARSAIDTDVKKVGLFYYVYPEGEAAADVYDRVSSFMELVFLFKTLVCDSRGTNYLEYSQRQYQGNGVPNSAHLLPILLYSLILIFIREKNLKQTLYRKWEQPRSAQNYASRIL